MLYPQDFFIRHKQLRESADKVLYIHSPIRKGKSWVEKAIQEQLATEFLNNQLIYCGYIIDDFEAWMPSIKLLRSKSKQPRMVAVVVNC